jgi:addiction module HigA family antidote
MFKTHSDSDPAPLHPGEILRVDILPRLGMAPEELAIRLAVPRPALDALLAERSAITLDLAQRLGLALGQGPHYWLALQMQFDLWQAERSVPDGVRPITWPRTDRRPGRVADEATA